MRRFRLHADGMLTFISANSLNGLRCTWKRRKHSVTICDSPCVAARFSLRSLWSGIPKLYFRCLDLVPKVEKGHKFVHKIVHMEMNKVALQTSKHVKLSCRCYWGPRGRYDKKLLKLSGFEKCNSDTEPSCHFTTPLHDLFVF